eukprot:TRINITY_DN1211_c1_g1_i1.p1 TRINITY_DN1211_c1_g1~~TRINITY_DN1211_c1_g1_i1.p1  ORF type:complete len:362 (-),score=104.75 TRINITY_DN1211_c1_g1_i1:40-1125(-)
MSREWDNSKTENGIRRAQNIGMITQMEKFWSSDQKLAEMRGATLEDLEEFIHLFLINLKVVALVQGNLKKEDSKKVMNEVLAILKNPRPLLPSQIPERRVTKLKRGSTYYHVSNIPNQHDQNSTIWNFYSNGVKSIKNSVLIELLASIIETPLYDNLRTKEQLGYIVSSVVQTFGNTNGFAVVIQSHHTELLVINRKIENFFEIFYDILKGMTESDLQVFVQSLKANKEQKFNKLSEELKFNWQEVCSAEFRFDRRKLFVEQLLKTKKEDLVQFYEERILNKEKRRKISYLVYGCQCNLPSVSSVVSSIETEEEVKNSDSFKPAQLEKATLQSGGKITLLTSGQEHLLRRELPYYRLGEKR